MAVSTTLNCPIGTSMVDESKQAWGTIWASMQNAFLVSSVGRCCNLFAVRTALATLFLAISDLGFIAVVTRAPSDLASLTMSSGVPSTTIFELFHSFLGGTEPHGFGKLRSCPERLSK